jgi:hypothetical protein
MPRNKPSIFDRSSRANCTAPLRDLELFGQVRIDPEIETLVWPNGADFDPATLHDWPVHKRAFAELARRWGPVQGSTVSPAA